MRGRRRTPTPETAGQAGKKAAEPFFMPDYPLELVLRDPISGRELTLGVEVTLRELETLGSAGLHYAEDYDNPERPRSQVQARKDRARRAGQAVWDAAVERCGIEDPTVQ